MIIKPFRLIVIGGGAAGFFSAITCAETHPDAEVILLEAGHQPLAKVRISGGGRCNVTHSCFDPAILVQNYPRGGKALRGALSRFQPQDTINWFSNRGVILKTESDGRMFPITDDSTTIVNCLIDCAQAVGVKIYNSTPVVSVLKYVTELDKTPGFKVILKSGGALFCDRLIVATGSNPLGYRWAKELGHTIQTPVPSLFTFNISDPRLKDLAGVSLESVNLRLSISSKSILEQTGALLITHWGLSGPAVLKLSAWGARVLAENHYQAALLINWLPEHNIDSLRQKLMQIKSDWHKRVIMATAPVNIPKRLWQRLVLTVGISVEQKWAELSNKNLNQLIQEICMGKYQIIGKGVFKEEFVTCGGVSLKEVDFKTMESRICSGLYFAGEILDIDGVTGGFNFQSAWTTGWIAGNM